MKKRLSYLALSGVLLISPLLVACSKGNEIKCDPHDYEYNIENKQVCMSISSYSSGHLDYTVGGDTEVLYFNHKVLRVESNGRPVNDPDVLKKADELSKKIIKRMKEDRRKEVEKSIEDARKDLSLE